MRATICIFQYDAYVVDVRPHVACIATSAQLHDARITRARTRAQVESNARVVVCFTKKSSSAILRDDAQRGCKVCIRHRARTSRVSRADSNSPANTNDLSCALHLHRVTFCWISTRVSKQVQCADEYAWKLCLQFLKTLSSGTACKLPASRQGFSAAWRTINSDPPK